MTADATPVDPAAELERVLAHLARFSSVLSHDLKAPLANVASFAQLLPTVSQLDEQGQLMAERMAVNARRAAHMVDAVLDHARRIGRRVTQPETVVLDDVMVAVDDALGDLIDEAGADLQWGELPEVSGDADSLAVLLRILVDNAVRYRDPDRPVHVRVDAATGAGEVDVTVTDDGPGIPVDKREDAFGLGVRLVDVAGPILGAGVGLATARVIAENHGGEIDLVDPPSGTGTAVRVRLPAAR